MIEIDVSKCKYYDSKDCICEYEIFNCEIEEFYKCEDNPDCYYKQLQQLKLKLIEINEIAHWRMGEVDIHLKNRLEKIQKIIRGEE